ASTIAGVLPPEPPPVAPIQLMSPPELEHVIKICLAKDPDDRFQTAHDLKLQLKWIAEAGSQAGLPAPVVRYRRRRGGAAWAVAGLFARTTVALTRVFIHRAPQPPQPMRLSAEIG